MTAAIENAPGALDLVRAFENTLNLPDGPDELDSVEHGVAWCLSHGLPPVADGPELERLRGFREALRDVLYANNGEGKVREAWERLRPFVSAAQLRLTVDSHRGLDLLPAVPESDGAIAALLAIVYEALLDNTWARLRACRKSSCRYAYYDRTKNASRAWCSMATCGNQEKAARRRLRERNAH
jgi:predicted RNA-binding Zn ribbon-like protein